MLIMEEFCPVSGCSEKSAISFDGKIYKVEEIAQVIRESKPSLGRFISSFLQKSDKQIHPGTNQESGEADYVSYFEEGIHFEILQPGSEEWVKGRMRLKISLEFVIDQPDLLDTETQSDAVELVNENSLDAIRQVSDTLTD
jgi:hypothetical protein